MSLEDKDDELEFEPDPSVDLEVRRRMDERLRRGGRRPSTVWEGHIAEIAKASGRSFEEVDEEAKLLGF
jgi:hypothetical protein